MRAKRDPAWERFVAMSVAGTMAGGVPVMAWIVWQIGSRPDFPGGRSGDGALDVVRHVVFGVSAGMLPVVAMVRGALLARSPQDATDMRAYRARAAVVVTSFTFAVVAVWGFVLFLLVKDARPFYLLAGGSLLLQAMYFPTPARWERWVKEGDV